MADATTPRKVPIQPRSRATTAAIVEAAARILERDGIDALNTNSVAKRAGVSIGSLYQYFPSKAAILAELIQRERGKRAEAVGAAIAATSTLEMESVVRAVVEAVLDYQFARPRLSLALEQVEILIPVIANRNGVDGMIADPLGALFETRGYRDPETVARDTIAIARGMIDTATLAGEQRSENLSRRVCAAVSGYLAATEVSDESRPDHNVRPSPSSRDS